MREALIRAATATPGIVSMSIFRAAKIKPTLKQDWKVNRGDKKCPKS